MVRTLTFAHSTVRKFECRLLFHSKENRLLNHSNIRSQPACKATTDLIAIAADPTWSAKQSVSETSVPKCKRGWGLGTLCFLVLAKFKFTTLDMLGSKDRSQVREQSTQVYQAEKCQGSVHIRGPSSAAQQQLPLSLWAFCPRRIKGPQ